MAGLAFGIIDSVCKNLFCSSSLGATSVNNFDDLFEPSAVEASDITLRFFL